MKKLIAIVLVASAFASLAASADARPRHQVCMMRHHHRVCSWR
jgi:hypothetical protein